MAHRKVTIAQARDLLGAMTILGATMKAVGDWIDPSEGDVFSAGSGPTDGSPLRSVSDHGRAMLIVDGSLTICAPADGNELPVVFVLPEVY